MEEHSERLTSGLSADYPRDSELSSFLASDQWTDTCLSLQTLFMQGMSGNKYVKGV